MGACVCTKAWGSRPKGRDQVYARALPGFHRGRPPHHRITVSPSQQWCNFRAFSRWRLCARDAFELAIGCGWPAALTVAHSMRESAAVIARVLHCARVALCAQARRRCWCGGAGGPQFNTRRLPVLPAIIAHSVCAHTEGMLRSLTARTHACGEHGMCQGRRSSGT